MQRAVQNGNALFAERGVTSLPQIGQIDMEKVIPRLIVTAIFLATIERVRRELPGTFAVCAERLDGDGDGASGASGDGGSRLAYAEHVPFPAASVIKIALALETLCAFEAGELDPSERVELREIDKVIGSGVLRTLTPGLRPSLLDLLDLSMTISDNTAANILTDRIGLTAVNARLASLGLETTRFGGSIFTAGGELSPTTAHELVVLLRAIHARQGLPGAVCDRLLALLSRTHTASTIGRGLPDERFPRVAAVTGKPPIAIAYKTGSLEGMVTEAGIVTTRGVTYAIALLSKDSGDLRPNHDNVGRVQLGEVSRAVYQSFMGACET